MKLRVHFACIVLLLTSATDIRVRAAHLRTEPPKMSCECLKPLIEGFKALRFTEVKPVFSGVAAATGEARAEMVGTLSKPSTYNSDFSVDESGVKPNSMGIDPLAGFSVVKYVKSGGFGSVHLMKEEASGNLYAVKQQTFQRDVAKSEITTGLFGAGKEDLMQAHSYHRYAGRLISITEVLSPCEVPPKVCSRFYKRYAEEGVVIKDRKPDNILCRQTPVEVTDVRTGASLGTFLSTQEVQIDYGLAKLNMATIRGKLLEQGGEVATFECKDFSMNDVFCNVQKGNNN